MSIHRLRESPVAGVRFEEPQPPDDPVSTDHPSSTLSHQPNHWLEPLWKIQNPSLISSAYPVTVGAIRHKIHKFLVLGKRAGGTPIRVCLFGGLDQGRSETIAAAAKVVAQLAAELALAQDYAIFGYPCVAPAGFDAAEAPSAYASLPAKHWKEDPDAPDALFFRREFQRFFPNGILTFRSSTTANTFQATVNSGIIAQEVIAPALLRLSGLLPVDENPVRIFATDTPERRRQFSEGRLVPGPDSHPWPFEVELTVPAAFAFEIKVKALVLAALDILKSYRTFVCHGGDL